MPVTARLSKRFYEQLGDDITNELVNWFNEVDATYRADLRELNELNFARFDAKVEQRFAESEARFEARLVQLEAKFETRLVQLEAKFEARLVRFEAQMEKRFIQFQAHVEQQLTEQREHLERRLGEQTRWFYVAWAAQMGATVAVLLKVYGR